MSIPELKSAVEGMLLERRRASPALSAIEKTLNGHPRITWEAQFGRYRRYVQFTPIADLPGRYGVLYGQWIGDENGGYGVVDDEQFDSRSLGDLDYCVSFVRAWLVDGVDWRALPPIPL